MGYNLTKKDFNQLLNSLNQEYQIYAPVRKKNKGTFSASDLITYDLVKSLEEIELDSKSKYSNIPLKWLVFQSEKHYLILLRENSLWLLRLMINILFFCVPVTAMLLNGWIGYF